MAVQLELPVPAEHLACAEPLRLLIADDEPLARELLRRYVGAVPRRRRWSASAATGDELAEALARRRPDVALLDIRMPGAGRLRRPRRAARGSRRCRP